jgi:drug/metabolite transporter (DMT)-like permease
MKKENKAQIVLILVSVIWGAGFPLSSIILKSMGTYTLVSVKGFLAATALFLIFHKKIGIIDKKMIQAGFLLALALVIGNLLQTGGMVFTSPSKCSFISGLPVIFVPIIISITHKKLPEKKKILAICIAIIGLYFLTYTGGGGLNLGDVLTMVSSIVYSFQIILVDRFGSKYDGIMLAAIELWFVGILALIPGIFLEGYHVELHSGIVLAGILITGLLGSGLGMAVQNKVQPLISPSSAALIYLFEPVFGAFFSVFIGDVLSPRALIGAALILGAMFLEK